MVNSNTHKSLFPSISEDSSQPMAPNKSLFPSVLEDFSQRMAPNIYLNVPEP